MKHISVILQFLCFTRTRVFRDSFSKPVSEARHAAVTPPAQSSDLDLSLQHVGRMAVDLAPPRSHVDTPAWQSFEMRMRARAAEHRAAKRKRRFRYVFATFAATLVGAGAVVAIEERPVLLAAWPPLTWPEPPAAPSLSLPAVPTPLPLPTNWDVVVVEQQIVEPLVIEQPVDSPPSETLTAQSERAAPAVEAPVRRAPREIEWPPPPRETSGPPVETARLAEPAPTPLSGLPAAAPPPAAPTSAATTTPISDPRESIRRAIERYREAYDRLDVSAAQAVWPRVDAGALARAFNSLSSQKVSFESCAITVSGTSADANCSGRSTVVPKIGGGSASARRTWQFRLREAARDEWVIQSATVK